MNKFIIMSVARVQYNMGKNEVLKLASSSFCLTEMFDFIKLRNSIEKNEDLLVKNKCVLIEFVI